MTFAQLVALFLEQKTRDSAENTVKFYRSQLRALLPLLGKKDIGAIGPADVLNALAKTGEGMKNATRRGRSIGVQQLQQFAHENELIPKLWLAKIPKPQIDNRTRIADAAETKAILKHAHKRFRVIYQALRLSAARPNELVRAQIEDWDRVTGCITLKTHKTARRTGKPKVIPVGRKLEQYLKLSIGRRQTGPIFLTPRGHAWTVNNLSSQFKRLRDAAGISDDLVLYSARHEAGTELCRRHGVLIASRLLGHSSIRTTERYVHPELAELAAAQDASRLG